MLLTGFELAHKYFPHGGTCLEFGVGQGTSYELMAKRIYYKYHHDILIGFDSWQGLPKETENVWFPERHGEGGMEFSKELVCKKLDKFTDEHDPKFRFVDGFYSDSLTQEIQKSITNLIFVNIDVDLHKSTLEVLNFIKPLLQVNTILYFDDWKDPYDGEREDGSAWGEHRAWADWIANNQEIETEILDINVLNQHLMRVKSIGK